MTTNGPLTWIKDETDPQLRSWEEFYRNRWQHDKVVRSTHGVNCTGGCTWQIYVKDGIVTWEMQGLDYPSLESGLPPYEPRGCQRGISFSWYLYSPLRVKHPYVRGALLDLWRTARAEHTDPVDAWKSLVEDPEKRARWQKARGKGGFRRLDWDAAVELAAASCIYTIQKYGPDRIAGFSPIPAMSMISYAAGARMLQLMGGVSLSFYDWYSDLPPASPEVWGEQTDVHESADWYNAKLLAVVGSNLNMTRTPDCHFAAEARHNGSKMWVFAPDFNQVAKYADEYIPINAGQDGAWWMAVGHVLLKECHHEQKIPYFVDYAKKYTDLTYLVELVERDGVFEAGQLLRANRIPGYEGVENGDWQLLMWDTAESKPKMPMGSSGCRWSKDKGKWNLALKDGLTGSGIDPALTFLELSGKVVQVRFDNFGEGTSHRRGVPVRRIETVDSQVVTFTTVYDLMMAQYGVARGLAGEYPANYDDENAPFTPAWQEKYTGMSRDTLIRFAREWGETARLTKGKCIVIIGSGVNHWYHNNLMYRSAINALMLCGCVGVNGGGLAHYTGQEKLAPFESWSSIAFAKDWFTASRLQNAPTWHYMHTDQWRYERDYADYHTMPQNPLIRGITGTHTADVNVQAVRNGWLPFYPQFDRSPLQVVRDAQTAGAKTDEDVVNYAVDELKSRKLRFSAEDPDAPENWPRVWFIWRGNALLASAKGHEYFLRHYLGTHDNAIAEDMAEGFVHDVEFHKQAPQGKMDLVVDLNFRMDTSALYSDLVLPAATWYEKSDLNTTDMHSFIHPLSKAVPPCWEAKSDWQIFRTISKKFSELAAKHFPEPVEDLVATPLAHDTAAEIAQPAIRDWMKGEVEAIPGKSMPLLRVVRRDYKNLYNQFISFGPLVPKNGLGAHGTHYRVDDFYEESLLTLPREDWDGNGYPSLYEDESVCNLILRFATVTNGELAYRSYQSIEERTGLSLVHLAEKNRGVRISYKELQSRIQRLINSPMWSGLTENGRAYSPYTYNVEEMVPWRTLTGRQHFYLDHPGYIQFGEHLATFKPKPSAKDFADLRFSKEAGKTLMLNYLTPHGKWHIHSTFGDNQRMTTLSRGVEPFWINDRDAAEIDVVDNDWVEVYNDNGVVVTRAAVSARIPRGICIQYHAPERTSVPKSPLRNFRRAGGHNSLTRIRLKPNLMVGGYAQFTFSLNYWGPTGCNRDTHILVRRLPDLKW